MRLPEQVRVRPYPHEGFERGFRTDCMDCRDEVWVEANEPGMDPFARVDCPACGNDIRPVLNVALGDPGLAHLRGRRLHVSEHPT